MKAFLEIARCGNFTRAAEELHICQPALTVQIKQLEHTLGVKLFDRDKRHVSLTQAGRDLLRPIERVIAEVDAISVTSHEFANHQRGIVTIGALPSIAASVLPGAIRQLNIEHPGIAVRLVELIGTRIAEAVKAGEVDLGIGSHARIDRELTYRHLWSDRMAAFVPARHVLAKKRSIALRDAANFPLVLTRPGSSVRVLDARVLERERLSVNVVHEVSYVPTILGLVAAGLGLAVLPEREFNATLDGTIRMLPIRSPQLIRNIGIIGNSAKSLSPAAERFVEVLRQQANPSIAAPIVPLKASATRQP
jgi:LysR family transcriptional regulator, carnitine catabolism transcriptional activator